MRIDVLRGEKAAEADVISGEALSQLVGQEVTPWDALMMFESESDDTADTHRRRLLFRLDYWYLDTPLDVADQPEAPVLSLCSIPVQRLQLASLSSAERQRLVFVQQDNNAFYLLPSSEPVLAAAFSSCDDALDVMQPLFADLSNDVAAQARHAYAVLDRLSLSLLKSLIQKTIRLGATFVRIDDTVPALRSDIALALVVLVALRKRTFNPNGGGVELGLHAFLKRLVIISIEDAWPADDHRLRAVGQQLNDAEHSSRWRLDSADVAAVLLWVALHIPLMLHKPGWTPSCAELRCWLRLAELARTSTSVWQCDGQRGAKIPPLALPSADVSSLSGPNALCSLSYLFEQFIFGMSG